MSRQPSYFLSSGLDNSNESNETESLYARAYLGVVIAGIPSFRASSDPQLRTRVSSDVLIPVVAFFPRK